MKNLVFGMLALLAMSFVSCDSLANKTEQEQDSIIYTIDSVSGDTISIDTIKVTEPQIVEDTDTVAPEETEVKE